MWKHLDDHIVFTNKTNLTSPLFIEVFVTSHESERSCICALRGTILTLFCDCSITFLNCYDNAIYIYIFNLF